MSRVTEAASQDPTQVVGSGQGLEPERELGLFWDVGEGRLGAGGPVQG